MKKLLLVFLMSFTLGNAFAFASFPVKKIIINTTEEEKVSTTENITRFVPVVAKSTTTAILLCLFIGMIGIHRFYLGYSTQGIIQIITLGGLGVWTMVDLVRLIVGTLDFA